MHPVFQLDVSSQKVMNRVLSAGLFLLILSFIPFHRHAVDSVGRGNGDGRHTTQIRQLLHSHF